MYFLIVMKWSNLKETLDNSEWLHKDSKVAHDSSTLSVPCSNTQIFT